MREKFYCTRNLYCQNLKMSLGEFILKFCFFELISALKKKKKIFDKKKISSKMSVKNEKMSYGKKIHV